MAKKHLKRDFGDNKANLVILKRCGYSSYDDFLELSPGGLQRLVNELQSFGYITNASLGNRTAGIVQRIRNLVSSFHHRIRGLVPPFRSQSKLPTSEPRTAVVDRTLHQPGTSCKFLHICVEKGRYSTRMRHIDVCEEATDRAMFDTLRKYYKETRQELNGILFKLRRIDFVQVRTHL